jgi:hypothetical protein
MTEAIHDFGSAWGNVERGGLELVPTRPAPRRNYVHYRPLSAAVDEFISEAQNDHRIYIGLDEFDVEMRGVSPGHLCLIVGRTHSGKTLLATHVLRHNRDKRVLLLTPDETSTLILAKLAAATHGINSVDLERRVAADDHEAIRLLHETVEEFPNLIVIDKRLSHVDMDIAFDEACSVWGAPPDALIVDFMKLVEGETMQAKFEFIKSFGMHKRVPTFALHQMSRSSGAGGQSVTLEGGEFGGEDFATFQIGVRRRKYQIESELRDLLPKEHKGGDVVARIQSLQEDLRYHEHTVTINLTKNKRPGGDGIDDMDFELDRATGRIYPLGSRMPRGYVAGLKPAVRTALQNESFREF